MKDEIYGNRVNTDLKIPEIKLFVEESISENFKSENFKFNKSNFTFKRGTKKDLQEIYFRFISSAPLNFNMKFSIRILNSAIELVKSNFSVKNKSELLDFATLHFFMGDFIDERIILRMVNKWNGLIYDKSKNEFIRDSSTPEIKSLTKGQISGFQYEIYDGKDLIESVKEIKRICVEKVIPLCNQVQTLDGIDKFFEDKQLSSVNSLRQNNFEVELIAAKLNGKRNLASLYKQIILLVDNAISMEIFDQNVKSYIENLYNYLK